MKDLVIVGAGGFGREVAELIEDVNEVKETWNLLGFIDETKEKQGTIINNYPVLGNLSWLIHNSNVFVVCAIGSPRDKYKLIQRMELPFEKFATLIHPTARISRTAKIGNGCIICYNSLVSVNTVVGDHVSINPNCGIGHDARIGDYCSLYWNVTLSGNVEIGNCCEIGSNADVLPKIQIKQNCIVGAGAVVTKNICENCTSVGVPAKVIKGVH